MVYSQLGSHIIFLFFPVFRLLPCKGGGMMGWFCLDARIQAKSFYHNTNDDSRNQKTGFSRFSSWHRNLLVSLFFDTAIYWWNSIPKFCYPFVTRRGHPPSETPCLSHFQRSLQHSGRYIIYMYAREGTEEEHLFGGCMACPTALAREKMPVIWK